MIVKNEENLLDETPLDSSQEGDELLPQHRKELERVRIQENKFAVSWLL